MPASAAIRPARPPLGLGLSEGANDTPGAPGVDCGSPRFVGAQLVQMLNVLQESGRPRSLGAWRRRAPDTVGGGRGIASALKGISTIEEKSLIGRTERHSWRTRIKYGGLRLVGNLPTQISHRLGAGDSGRSPCLRRRCRLHRIERTNTRQSRGPICGAAGGVQLIGNCGTGAPASKVEAGGVLVSLRLKIRTGLLLEIRGIPLASSADAGSSPFTDRDMGREPLPSALGLITLGSSIGSFVFGGGREMLSRPSLSRAACSTRMIALLISSITESIIEFGSSANCFDAIMLPTRSF
jgi:hypothetical protein